MTQLFFQSFCTKNDLKSDPIFFQTFCTKKWPNFFFNLFALKSDPTFFSIFLTLKSDANIFEKFLVTFYGWKILHTHVSTSFFWTQKMKSHLTWWWALESKFDLKTGFQTLLSFFLVGLFSRPRYQKYSPWTGDSILRHRSTHKRVKAIQNKPNNRQKIENFPKSMF